jgi:hypothetical protein
MSQSIFHVRPLDGGKGWAIDEYDGRGAWQRSVLKTPEGSVMDKQTAQRAVFQLRRKAVNSAPKTEPLNKNRDTNGTPSGPEWVPCEVCGAEHAGDGPTPCSPPNYRCAADPACADMLESTDVRALIKTAHQHWFGIGWPEDKVPVALLERAMELLGGTP